MKSVSYILFMLLLSTTLLAQSTTIKLPTTDNTSSFNITKSDDVVIMKVNADGGFYAGASYRSGTIPVEGTGARMMWYPGQAAFRAGYTNSTQWDAGNIGIYSIAMGCNTTASENSSTAMGNYTTASGGGSTAMGYQTTASGYYSTAMGYQTTASGAYTTAMGTWTTASGLSSTAMGNYVSTGGFEGAFVLGDNSTTTVRSADNSNQLTMRFAGGYHIFTNPGCTTGLWMAGGGSSWSTYSDSSKKENFVRADGEYFLRSLSKLRLGSWNYKVQDPKEFRHYGPMAQEIFHYFGKDEYGIIGNDTSLATADMDGIMMICLQALEKRTSELKNAEEKIALLERSLSQQNSIVEELSRRFSVLESKINAAENVSAQLSFVNSKQNYDGAEK